MKKAVVVLHLTALCELVPELVAVLASDQLRSTEADLLDPALLALFFFLFFFAGRTIEYDRDANDLLKIVRRKIVTRKVRLDEY